MLANINQKASEMNIVPKHKGSDNQLGFLFGVLYHLFLTKSSFFYRRRLVALSGF